ncbi:MAG: heparin/heparin-sulfate lyase HepB [Bryobacteraceae bacterium]
MLFIAFLLAAGVPDAAWMDVGGVRVPEPPKEHPRLYLRARDLPDLERRTTALKPAWDDLQRLARSNAQISVEVDALRYLLGRDADLARRTLASALELITRAEFDLKKQDITRPIGRMLVTGAIAYDWCYAALTPEHKRAFQEQMLRLARQLECGYPPRAIGSVTGHGSEWMIMRDMLSAGIALYDEFPEMYRLAAARFFGQHLPARNYWYAGHAFHQGSSYAETRFVSEMYPLWIFDRLGAGNVYSPSQQFVPYNWIYMRRGDGQLLRSGDGQSKEPKLRSLLCASYYGDPYVMADYLRAPGIDPMSKIFEFLWADPDLKPRPVSELPLSRYFGEPYGWLVARTGWDANSVVAEMKTNIYNFVNHQHPDAGAFQIYWKGPLAIDSGVYQGYGSPHHSNYHKRTIAHNTLLVYDPSEKFTWGRGDLRNDGGQRLCNNWRETRTIEDLLNPANGYRTGEVLGRAVSDAWSYMKSDITAAYGPKVKQAVRSFAFLNLESARTPAALIVFDRVVSAAPEFRKYWLLHSMGEPQVSGNTTVVSRLVNQTLTPEDSEIEKVGAPGKEFWVFGENFPIERPLPADYEAGAWRVQISPRRPAAEDLFLNVMQMTEDRPAPVSYLQAPGLAGARVGDRVVWFARSGQRAASVSFTLKTAAKCLVADLAEGTWQIWRDGRIVRPAVEVSGETGALYFDAAPGAYTLRR